MPPFNIEKAAARRRRQDRARFGPLRINWSGVVALGLVLACIALGLALGAAVVKAFL